MKILLLFSIVLFWTALYLGVRRWPIVATRAVAPRLAEFIAATGLLALATVGFFWQILLTDSAWMPAGGGDLAPFLYPNYYFAAEHLRQGTLPLWNPHLYSGAPFAADIQAGLFYPLNWIVFLLAPMVTFEWLEYLAIFHFWLAGATMYICLRLLFVSGQNSAPLSPLAAFFGAVAFEFSDLFIVHFGNLNMIAVAAWLPLIFLLYHHSLRRASYGFAAAAGAVLAIATLAGHIQITLFILLTLGLYTLWDLRFWLLNLGLWIFDKRPAKSALADPQESATAPVQAAKISKTLWQSPRSYTRPVSNLLITLLITIGLSALLLVPAYEMSRYTPRAELPYEEAAQYSLHPVQMIGLLIPNYFGRDPALHWGPWERVETGYIGLITLSLALVGLLLYPKKIKGFFVTLAIIALLLAMGGYTLLHGWLYVTIPGFDQLRAPARFILLLDFALAMLAAFGVNQLVQPLADEAKEIFGKLLKFLTWGLAALIIVAGPLSYYAMLVTQDRNPVIFNRTVGAASGIATFAIFAIVTLVVLHLINTRRLREVSGGMAMIAVLILDLFTLGANVDVGYTNPTAGFNHPEAVSFLQADPGFFRTEVTTDVWHLWQPNIGVLYRLDDVWGLYNPLTLADTTLFWSGAPPRSSGRYNFLGIKYIIASKAGAPADGDIVPVFDQDAQINIYLNQDALARILFVGQAIVAPNHEAAWTAVRADDFDPATSVILESGQPLDTVPESNLALLQYDLHTVTVAVDSNQAGYLVLSDAYYPGWRATVDGRPESIHRANYAFRAVYVPAGQHTVQFLFDPWLWKVGLSLSGITLLFLIGWGGRRWLKR